MLRRSCSFLLIALIVLVSAQPIFAANTRTTDPENDEDDSTSFTLETCSIKNLDSNIPLDPIIELDYNKNVVNISVTQNNIGCFHLVDENRESIPIELIFPDDQLQQDVKRNIFIRPKADLDPETTYTLIIDDSLMAKNGSYIDKAYKYVFTTGISRAQESNTLLDSLGDNIVIYTSNLPASEASSSASDSDAGVSPIPEESAGASLDTQTLSYTILAVAAVSIIILIVLQILKRGRTDPKP